jgi:hypothetical protein
LRLSCSTHPPARITATVHNRDHDCRIFGDSVEDAKGKAMKHRPTRRPPHLWVREWRFADSSGSSQELI